MLEALLQKSSLAWNPIGHIREAMTTGKLTVNAVLPTCAGIVIAASLANAAALNLFVETLTRLAGQQYVPDALFGSKIVQEYLAALTLLPFALLAFLPKRLFYPAGKNPAIAATLVVMTSQVFVAAIIQITSAILASFAIATDPIKGLAIVTMGGAAAFAAQLFYLTFMWRKATKLLGIGFGASAVMVGTFVLGLIGLAGVLLSVIGDAVPAQ